jgi:hypothetical protein
MNGRHEVMHLLRQIQSLTLEVAEQEKREAAAGELDAKERALEELRWRLVTVSRHTAHAELGNAAA